MAMLNHCQILLAWRIVYSEFSADLLIPLAAKMAEEPFKLLIMDSITANLRVDFSGRGELADRQQKLGQMMARLRKVSKDEIQNCYCQAICFDSLSYLKGCYNCLCSLRRYDYQKVGSLNKSSQRATAARQNRKAQGQFDEALTAFETNTASCIRKKSDWTDRPWTLTCDQGGWFFICHDSVLRSISIQYSPAISLHWMVQ